MEKKLYRDEHHKVIGGVCAGLADYFGIDVSIVRLVFVLTLILKGGGGLLYIILWIVLPKRPFSYIPRLITPCLRVRVRLINNIMLQTHISLHLLLYHNHKSTQQ